MAEALAYGTPVIALRNGSVPEVIDHGVTGFICSNEEEMLEAVGRLDEIDRARCRAEAERRFSPGAMAAAYVDIDRQLLGDAASAIRQPGNTAVNRFQAQVPVPASAFAAAPN